MFIQISKTDTDKLTANFRRDEFFTKSEDFPETESHNFDYRLVLGCQALRDWSMVSWHITSSFRTRKHQKYLNTYGAGAVLSYHELGRAVDLQPVHFEDRAKFIDSLHRDIEQRKGVFNTLRKIGVTGFCMYDTFIHLDTRTEKFNNRDANGQYMVADYRKKKAPYLV